MLEKKLPADNEVYRCRDCGYLFSPGTHRPAAVTTDMETASDAAARPAAMTTAMEVAPSAARPAAILPEAPAPAIDAPAAPAAEPPPGGN